MNFFINKNNFKKKNQGYFLVSSFPTQTNKTFIKLSQNTCYYSPQNQQSYPQSVKCVHENQFSLNCLTLNSTEKSKFYESLSDFNDKVTTNTFSCIFVRSKRDGTNYFLPQISLRSFFYRENLIIRCWRSTTALLLL